MTGQQFVLHVLAESLQVVMLAGVALVGFAVLREITR